MSIEVRYRGRLGNNLFQYAFARLLAETLGRELVCVSPPGTALGECAAAFVDAPQHLTGHVIVAPHLRYTRKDRPLWDEHGVDLGSLQNRGAERRIVLDGLFQQSEYYLPARHRIRQWFAPRSFEPPVPDIHPDDVIVHIRRGDYVLYRSAVRMDYYQHVLDAIQPRRVFVTGVGIDEDTHRALARYEPQWLDLNPLTAMWTLAAFHRIVGSNSSFSWWGAFLSHATEVYFPRPRSGFWSRETSRIALEIQDVSWHYVDAVEVEDFRPSYPRWRALELCEATPDNQTSTLRATSVDGQVSDIAIEPCLVPVCHWLAARSAPFDYEDVVHLVEGKPYAPFIKLLTELARVGVLSVWWEAHGEL